MSLMVEDSNVALGGPCRVGRTTRASVGALCRPAAPEQQESVALSAESRIDVPKEFNACVRALAAACSTIRRTRRNPRMLITGSLSSASWQSLNASPIISWYRRSSSARSVGVTPSGSEKGLVPRPTTDKVSFNLIDLPEICAREITNILKRKLEPTLTKANRQIRETKRALETPDAAGLVILVNDGNHAHTPEMMGYLLGRITNRQLSFINSVSYLSINEPIAVSGFPTGSRFWIDWISPVARQYPHDFAVSFETSGCNTFQL
jgi:hypothetical protein